MKNHHLVLLCFAFVAIFCTSSVFSLDTVTILSKHDKDMFYFPDKQRIELKCNTTGDVKDLIWKKNDIVIPKTDPNDKYEILLAEDVSILVLNGTRDSDSGNYTCSLGSVADYVKLATVASSKWGLRVNRNVNVVQGEKLTLKCEVRGKLSLEWFFRNASHEDNYTKIETGGRYTVKNYKDEEEGIEIVDGQFELMDADLWDRGDYMCVGETYDHVLKFNSSSMIRIKDKYAALWPFLGICAEVFVLCGIILVYEKKRNKTELEESDTDQSPDQKNTPDNGKETNLRHRQ